MTLWDADWKRAKKQISNTWHLRLNISRNYILWPADSPQTAAVFCLFFNLKFDLFELDYWRQKFPEENENTHWKYWVTLGSGECDAIFFLNLNARPCIILYLRHWINSLRDNFAWLFSRPVHFLLMKILCKLVGLLLNLSPFQVFVPRES